MTTPTQKAEVLFLKIFKVTVLLIMGLSLISILFLCLNAAYQYSQTPKKPAPAQIAPEKDPAKEISIDALKQFLLEREKQENNNGEAAPQKNAPQASLLFLEEATTLYRCSVDFGKKVGIIIEEADDTQNLQRLNDFRWKMERLADSPLLGEAWIKAAKSFVCAALADESIILLKKEGKIKSIFYPILEFHAETWKKIQNEKVQFDQKEKDRVDKEWSSELNRVSAAKAFAIANLIAAGCSFGVFMFLALYLLAAKIETNLRDINESIRKNERKQTNTACEIE